MGYYSEVALALTKTGRKILKEKLADPTLPKRVYGETRSLFEKADKHLVDKDSGAEVWYWHDIKWYTCDPEYFPDVDFIDNFIGGLDPDDYRFVRVGEDNEDTEVHGDYCDDPFDLTLCRNIHLENME